jgi:hypothetical protein
MTDRTGNPSSSNYTHQRLLESYEEEEEIGTLGTIINDCVNLPGCRIAAFINSINSGITSIDGIIGTISCFVGALVSVSAAETLFTNGTPQVSSIAQIYPPISLSFFRFFPHLIEHALDRTPTLGSQPASPTHPM